VDREAPELAWTVPQLRPAGRRARLFVRTLLPKGYTAILHGNVRDATRPDGSASEAERGAQAYGPDGESRGPVPPDRYHLQYGKSVLQIDPGTNGTRTVFLHVLTAVDAAEESPPETSWRRLGPQRIEVTVEGKAAVLDLPMDLPGGFTE
jgi:hypothetical protein